MNKKLAVYQADNGSIELNLDVNNETIWASLKDISQLFGADKSGISRHIKNIFSEKELDEKSTVAFFATVQTEGSREVTRNIECYNLDMIISIGYRVNSKKATLFRQWASKTLKQHITQGYTINLKRIEKNYAKFIQAVENVKQLTKNKISNDAILELIQTFAHTWFSLASFDEDKLPKQGSTQTEVKLQAEDLYECVTKFKQNLTTKKQATSLFAQEKQQDALAGIFGNVMQSVFGEPGYPSIEEKAAHLLYFIVKNHPFNDGNKRTGAFVFIWFLQQSSVEFRGINPQTLSTLTLFIAQSDSKEKDKIIGLILLLLNS
jgi:prophage maintenance system killer protein